MVDHYGMGQSIGIVPIIIWIVFTVFFIAVGWRVYTKAGKPGWAVLVPIYNLVVFLQIINRPLWWIVLFFVPVVNFVVAIIMVIDLAKSFGKGVGFGLGLLFLGIIFYPLLAFGDAEYTPITR